MSVSTQPNEVGPEAVLEFWVQALISQHLWYREEPILFLMDHLCKTAFQLMQEDCVQKLLYQQHKVNLLEEIPCSQWLDSSLLKSPPKAQFSVLLCGHRVHFKKTTNKTLCLNGVLFYFSNRSALVQIPIKSKEMIPPPPHTPPPRRSCSLHFAVVHCRKMALLVD